MTCRQVMGLGWIVSLANVALAGDTVSPDQLGRRVDGQVFTARFVDVIDDGQLLFDRSGQREMLQPSELVVWGTYTDRDQGTQVLLANGGVLVADIRAIEADVIVIGSRLWTETRLPKHLVRAIVFRPPMDTLARDQLFFRAATEVRGEDRLLLENGDELAGQQAHPMVPASGESQPTALSWLIRDRNRSIDVPLDRVDAWLFASTRPGIPTTAPATLVGFRDGSWLPVRRWRCRSGALEIDLSDDVQLITDPTFASASNPWDPVGLLQPLTSRVTYLSDLEPLGYKHTAFLDTSWPYHRDRSASGGRLRHNRHVIMKGLGMHSSARLAYELAGQYRWFEAELAIDERASRQGSVSFRVFVQDQNGGWSKEFESPTIRGNQPVVPLRVNIQAANCLALIVDFAERADQWDHANWLNARLVPNDD